MVLKIKQIQCHAFFCSPSPAREIQQMPKKVMKTLACGLSGITLLCWRMAVRLPFTDRAVTGLLRFIGDSVYRVQLRHSKPASSQAIAAGSVESFPRRSGQARHGGVRRHGSGGLVGAALGALRAAPGALSTASPPARRENYGRKFSQAVVDNIVLSRLMRDHTVFPYLLRVPTGRAHSCQQRSSSVQWPWPSA